MSADKAVKERKKPYLNSKAVKCTDRPVLKDFRLIKWGWLKGRDE